MRVRDRLILMASALLTLLMGALVATVASFIHRGTPPFMLIVGALVVALFVLGVRWGMESPLATAAAFAGCSLAVVLLALGAGDRPVVIADDLLGWVWLVGVPLVALAAAALPLRKRRTSAPN